MQRRSLQGAGVYVHTVGDLHKGVNPSGHGGAATKPTFPITTTTILFLDVSLHQPEFKRGDTFDNFTGRHHEPAMTLSEEGLGSRERTWSWRLSSGSFNMLKNAERNHLFLGASGTVSELHDGPGAVCKHLEYSRRPDGKKQFL